jgi:hypothetical protein
LLTAAKVAKAEASAVAVKRRAEFEARLAMIYSYDDDENCRQCHEYVQTATEQAYAERLLSTLGGRGSVGVDGCISDELGKENSK